jgi:uncharacterized protein (DUF302 family)
MSHYGFSVTLSGQIDDVVERVTTALQAEKFGIVTTIDVQAIFKAKLEIDHRPYRILGACNPNLGFSWEQPYSFNHSRRGNRLFRNGQNLVR